MEGKTLKPSPSLMTIEPEVRLEILRNLLLLERNETVTYTSAYLTDTQFTSLAKDPYANIHRYAPGQWWSDVKNDTFLQTGLQREFRYRPSLAILRVCKQLKAEGEEVLYKENHYIGIHDAPADLINKMRRIGIGYRRWRGDCDRLLPQPVLQIDFQPARLEFRPDRWLLLPPSDLGHLSLALYNSSLYLSPNLGFNQRMHLRIWPGNRLLQAFGCKEIGGVKDLLQNNFIDWIGSDTRGCLADGMSTPSLRDRHMGEAPPLARIHPAERSMRHIRRLRDDFEKAYALHASEGLVPAIPEYLNVRDKIWFVARNCTRLSVPSQIMPPIPEYHLLAMLSWILYQIASMSTPNSLISQRWRVLFAHRALTLPSYVPATEWKMRIHVLAAGILGSFPGLRTLRVHHLVRAGSLLELANDNLVSQQLCGLQAMVTSRTRAAQSGVSESIKLIEAGLKMEMKRKYGVEAVISHVTLDDELMGLEPTASMLLA